MGEGDLQGRSTVEDTLGKDDDDDDDDDDFECDIERYVPFEEKIELAEKLKTCSKECLTQIIKIVTEMQPTALDDYGNSRVQLKIDMVEREVYLKCIEVHQREEGVKRQKV